MTTTRKPSSSTKKKQALRRYVDALEKVDKRTRAVAVARQSLVAAQLELDETVKACNGLNLPVQFAASAGQPERTSDD